MKLIKAMPPPVADCDEPAARRMEPPFLFCEAPDEIEMPPDVELASPVASDNEPLVPLSLLPVF